MASGSPDEDYSSLESTTDVELLKKAWRNEKAAPEILEFQFALIERCRGQIQLAENNIEEDTERGVNLLSVSIYQMDVERVQFLLRSYLRIRLQKIWKDVVHICKTELWNRLSNEEQTFAKRCYEDMKSYHHDSVLSKLPSCYQSNLKQSNASEEDDMIPEPKTDAFVFCKIKGSIGAMPLDESGDEILDLLAGDLYVLRFKTVKPYLENGQIDLV